MSEKGIFIFATVLLTEWIVGIGIGIYVLMSMPPPSQAVEPPVKPSYVATHQPRAVYGTDAREYCIHGQVFIFSNDGMMQGLVDGVKYEPIRCKE